MTARIPPTDTRRHIPRPDWEIGTIVSELRTVRLRCRQEQERTGPPLPLPSRKALARIVDNLSAALYPSRLGAVDLSDDSMDYFVGHTLDATLQDVFEQVRRELHFQSGEAQGRMQDRHKAMEITRAFAHQLPAVRALLDSDIRAAYEGDPAAGSPDEVLVCYPGTMAILYHRIAHVLHSLGMPLMARMIAEIAHSATGIDIHPGAQINGSFFIDHGTGVVIGETAIIGERVRLYQAVTLGAKRFLTNEDGTLTKGNARHPIVEDDVVIYAGATILGRVTIGRGSVIGGNVWLTRSVPPFTQVSQAQAREVFDGGAGI